jgi:chromosome segregation ATPase
MEEVSRLSRTQHSHQTLQSQVQELETLIQAHTDRLFEVTQQHEDVTHEVERLQRQRQQVAQSLDAERNEHDQQVASLRRTISAIEAEQTAASDRLQELQNEYVTAETHRADLQCELELLREEFAKTTSERNLLLATLRNQTEQLQAEKMGLDSELSQRRAQLEGLRETHGDLELRVRECRESKQELDSELARLLDQIHDQQATLDTLTEATRREMAVQAALQLSVNDLSARLEVQKREFQSKQMQIHDYAGRLEKMANVIRGLTELEEDLRLTDGETPDPNRQGRLPGPAPATAIHGPHWGRWSDGPTIDATFASNADAQATN